jgi:uncharacterized protein
MTIEVWCSDDPVAVMDRVGGFLESEPVLHNLPLTILRARQVRPEPGRYWVPLDDGEPVGLAWQSPADFVAGVVPMATAAVDRVVAAIVEEGVDLPGVNGDAGTAARFTGQWTERRGTAASPVMGMRIYELTELVLPTGVSGSLRAASPADRETVAAMVVGFHEDTGERGEVAIEEWVDLRIDRREVWLWDDGRPVAMAAHTSALAGAVRIQAVYTPPEHRRRGYAGAVVAGLSGRLVGEGSRALLFTDLGNPTSNSVYRRIGFRAVAENLRYAFERRHAADV